MSSAEREYVRTPQWVAIPVDRPLQCERAGLDPATTCLDFVAWGYAMQHGTDGMLPTKEAERLPYSTPSRRRALVWSGLWQERPDGFEILGFLDVNRTVAQRDAQRAANLVRQRRFRDGRAADTTDVAQGESAGADELDQSQSEYRQVVSDNALRNAPLPITSPSPLPEKREEDVRPTNDLGGPQATHRNSDQPYRRMNASRTVSIGKARSERKTIERIEKMPDWDDPRWSRFSDVWYERGFGDPPTEAQMQLLWPFVLRFPDNVAGFLEEAPRHVPVYDVIGYIVEVSVLYAEWLDLSPVESEEWSRLEAGYPAGVRNPLKVARETGLGLPARMDGVNRYRARLVDEVDRLEPGEAPGSRVGTHPAIPGPSAQVPGWKPVSLTDDEWTSLDPDVSDAEAWDYDGA